MLVLAVLTYVRKKQLVVSISAHLHFKPYMRQTDTLSILFEKNISSCKMSD